MGLNSVEDVFRLNDVMSKKLRSVVEGISAEQAETRPSPDRWSVAEIVEHVAIVEGGIVRICSKLIGKAKAGEILSDGTFYLSPEFISGSERIEAMKLEAPERTHPKGTVLIADSLKLIDGSYTELLALREDIEKYDARSFKFPHPYLGDMSALEWLVLAGGHKSRHLKQILAHLS